MRFKQLTSFGRLSLLLFAAMVGWSSSAQTFNYTYEGDALTYSVQNEHEVSVYSSKVNNWYADGDVIIPATVTYDGVEYTVTSVANDAFSENNYVTGVTLPSTVTELGSYAFRSCTKLDHIDLSNVSSIGRYAFSSCTKLDHIDLSNVSSIGSYAFMNCTSLQSVSIPASVEKIERYTFCNCTSLTQVRIEDSETSIDLYDNIFQNAPVKDIYIGRNWRVESSDDAPTNWIEGTADNRKVESVTVGGFITGLRDYAFDSCPNLKTVTILDTVKGIGYCSFAYCTSLTDVTLPESLTTIDVAAFFDCTALKSIRLPESVTIIGDQAFAYCTALEDINIPGSLTTIAGMTFYNCPIANIVIPATVTEIGEKAFYRQYYHGCNLTIGDSATAIKIGSQAFSGVGSLYLGRNVIDDDESGLKVGCRYLTFSNYVTRIPSRLCAGGGLEQVAIPNSVTEIGELAFYKCPLTNIEIPESVKSIGEGAFWNCGGMTSVQLPESLETIADNTFNGCSSLNYINIPKSLKVIGSSAFSGCTALTNIEIPATVETLGEAAFYGCNALENIYVGNPQPCEIDEKTFKGAYDTAVVYVPDELVPAYLLSDWVLFQNLRGTANQELGARFSDGIFNYGVVGDKSLMLMQGDYSSITNLTVPQRVDKDGILMNVVAIGNYAFANCTNITSVSLPKTLTAIYEGGFAWCSNLTSVELPEAVTTLGLGAFYQCTKLESVTLGSKVSSIGDQVFRQTNLKSIVLPESVTTIGNSMFYDCNNLTSVTLGSKVTSIGDWAFTRTKFTSIDLPKTLVSIGDYAFCGSNLTSLKMPDSVTSIGVECFYNSTYLRSVTLSSQLDSIPRQAFQNTGLRSIDLPESIILIGERAFSDCTSLSQVKFSSRIDSIKGYAFCGTAMASLELPASLTFIGNSAFRNIGNLKSVTFNPGLVTIDEYAFNNSSIESVYLPEGLTTLGDYAFMSCPNLSMASLPGTLNSVGAKAFQNTALSTLELRSGDEPIEISNEAFGGANQITTLNLDREYTFVGEDPFAGITTLMVGNELGSIADNQFDGFKNLANLTLGSSITSIGDNAFKDCKLTNVVLPPALETIGENAFAGNNNLACLAIGANVTAIGANAFNCGGTALQNIYVTAMTPPSAANTSFSNYGAQLWVMPGMVDTYYDTTPCWYRFEYGKEMVVADRVEVDYTAPADGLKPGDKVQLTATVAPETVTLNELFWISSDPSVASVDNNGLVTYHGQPSVGAKAAGDMPSCVITARTLYSDGPVAEVTISSNGMQTGVEETVWGGNEDVERPNDIYNLQGMLIKRDATADDVKALTPGLYIIGGKKVVVK